MREEGLRSLDYVVTTHYDADHFHGVIQLLEMAMAAQGGSGQKKPKLTSVFNDEDVAYVSQLLKEAVFIDPGEEIGQQKEGEGVKGLDTFQSYRRML